VPLPFAVPRPVLAYGAELKSTFCLALDRHAFLSPHIGDLESFESLRAFSEGIAHFERLFDATPALVAHDLHPEYGSTKLALAREGVEREPVQHHHAHAVACLAEHGESGPALAVCFDGLGLGDDGALWGGEFLVASACHFERRGRFAPVPLPGGSAAIREPWRAAAAHLEAAGIADAAPALAERQGDRWQAVLRLARSGVASPASSSVGRLFDAAAALLGVRDVASYEGQAAVELEQLADPGETTAPEARVADGALIEVAGADLIRALVEDLRRGIARPAVAARFHNGVARACVAVCRRLRDETGLATVALSGGVFQNALLLERVRDGLSRAGFRVLVHERVPPNDGGIAFGQAVIAAARDRARGARPARPGRVVPVAPIA
jgi:hydrogenase maturation protein HypF